MDVRDAQCYDLSASAIKGRLMTVLSSETDGFMEAGAQGYYNKLISVTVVIRFLVNV